MTRYKIASLILVVILGFVLAIFLHNKIDKRKLEQLNDKIKSLEEDVLRSEAASSSAEAQRDEYKKQADEILPKIREVESGLIQINKSIESTNNSIKNERNRHENIKVNRNPNNSVLDEFNRACARLKEAGLIDPNSPCN
jgi:septal ring factor EnvC (AmiA/AmiB activator)